MHLCQICIRGQFSVQIGLHPGPIQALKQIQHN
jgi:hypothetical protein